jgi:hypothetical protein
MSKPRILTEESYTFSKYFDLVFDIEDILAEFDCTFDRASLTLPRFEDPIDTTDLHQQILDGIEYVTLSSEQARREFLVAPIVRYLCRQTHQRVRVEYPVSVNEKLKGTLDYYFRDLLIIEAKRDNLENGFTQLAVELIALDQWTNSSSPILYGTVTTGETWRFGTYDRAAKQITQSIPAYSVPQELEALVRVLIGILQN